MTRRDGVLEDYLNGGTALSRAYLQQSNELPPESVDNAIVAAARREVGSRPGHAVRRWQVPASMAAGLVLAVGMVAFLNQRIGGLDAQNDVEMAQSNKVVTQTQVAQLNTPAAAQTESAMSEPTESKPVTAREQTLARAAADADKQAVAVARQSLAAVSADPAAKSAQTASAGMSFAEKFKRLQVGLKPAQIAVLLGEPSRKETGLWVYKRITTVPGRALEYRVAFNEQNELKEWSRKEIQDSEAAVKP
jgi:hypothetical protein